MKQQTINQLQIYGRFHPQNYPGELGPNSFLTSAQHGFEPSEYAIAYQNIFSLL